MGQPAAKQGDHIVALDTHIIMVPSPGGPVPTPLPHPFDGVIEGDLSSNVNVMGSAAATLGSLAYNQPVHIPEGGPFQRPPSNQGRIVTGSMRVMVNGKPAARNGDTALTCNDPIDLPIGSVIAESTVIIG